MAIDPRLSLEAKTPDIFGAIRQGQQAAITAANAPLDLQQKSADIANSLTDVEKNKLALEQAKRQEAFNLHIKDNPPVFDSTGKIDVAATSKKLFDQGQGQYAFPFIAEALKSNAAQATNQNELLASVKNAAITLAQAARDLPPNEKQAAQSKANDFLQKTYGVSPASIFGTDNWIDIASKAPTSELQAGAETRANITSLTTKEDIDAKSQKSSAFRKFVADNFGVTLPDTVSIGSAAREPLYQKYVDSYLIGGGARTEALGGIAEAQTEKESLSNLKQAMSNGELTRNIWWKQPERIVNIFKTITNDTERAKFTQLINEAKSLGIEIDDSTTLSGVIDALDRRLKTVGQKQAGKTAIATGSGINAAAARASTTAYVGPNGKIYRFSEDDLQNPQVQAAIKSGQLKK